MKKTQNNGSSTRAHSIPATPPESLGNFVDASTPIDAEIDAVNGGDTLLTVHRIASRLFQSGAFDKATMRQFDEICLTPIIQMGSSEIRELREHTGVSQAVLARILNVTVSTVGQWERGEKKPTGSALKLLALMQSKGVGAVL
jgi:putative transcriptional regulator